MLRRLPLFPLLLAALLVMPAAASASGLQLDGINGYVEAGLDPTESATTTPRTWEAWVKTTATSTQTVISRYRNAVGQEPFVMDITNGTPRIWIQNGIDSYAYRQGGHTVNDGQWHHLAAVWVPSTRLDFYIDGQPSNGTLHTPILPNLDTATGVSIRIGISHDHGNLYAPFNGALDGIRYSTGARWAQDESFTPDECPDADTATIAVWNFEEGSGTTTNSAGLQPTAGTFTGGAAFGDGFSCGGDALRFDGDNDRVEAPADPTANDNTAARTWEAWVKTTSNERQTILGRFPAAGEAPWTFDMEDGIARIHIQHGSAHGARYASKTMNDGQWHHLAAVWVPGTRLDLYIDGEKSNGPLGGGAVPASIAVAANAPMRIGAGQDDDDRGADDFFDGDLDSVRYSEGARYDESFDPEDCWNVDANTIALWTFDEGEGSTTASRGQVEDEADLLGGVRWVAGLGCEPGESETGGSALLLSGSDQYVEAGVDPTESATTTPRTWEAWVKTTATSTQTVISRYRNAVGQEPFVMDITNGTPRIWIQNGIDSYAYRQGGHTVNDGQWHHLAAVWVPSTRLDFYIDGQPSNGTLHTPILPNLDTATGVSIRIGISHDHGNLYAPFNGALDGIRYSTGARYGAMGFTPDVHPDADADTIGLWNFDEGAGTSAAVSGQMSAAATLINGAGWTTGPTA